MYPRTPTPWIGIAILALSGLLAMAAVQPAAAAAPWMGAAFDGDRRSLERLAAAGATAVRIYDADDAWVLDEAQRLGMGVVFGLWITHRRHGAALQDPATVDAIGRELLTVVARYRDHPALLAWGIGNEVETADPDPGLAWAVVDRIAAQVKAADPVHPTMMVVADAGPERLRLLAGCCANIDLLGINVYGAGVFDLPQRLQAAGVDRPVVVTELGALGQWQAGRKPWGAPVELSSTDKAAYLRTAIAFLRRQPQVTGVFAFLWGAKQEQTATWHGLLLADGSLTEMTDALAEAWGRPSAQAAPWVRGIGISADRFRTGEPVSVGLDAGPVDGTPPLAEWRLFGEAADLREGGDDEAPPREVEVRFEQADVSGARFTAPATPGAYRLFVTLRGADGKAATANLPFEVVARDR